MTGEITSRSIGIEREFPDALYSFLLENTFLNILFSKFYTELLGARRAPKRTRIFNSKLINLTEYTIYSLCSKDEAPCTPWWAYFPWRCIRAFDETAGGSLGSADSFSAVRDRDGRFHCRRPPCAPSCFSARSIAKAEVSDKDVSAVPGGRLRTLHRPT